MSTCSGAPPSGRRTKGAPSPGAVRGSPELYYTRFTWITQGKKTTFEQVNNTQNSTKGSREQKGSRGPARPGRAAS